MSEVSAVSVSPAWALPLMVGAPVAGVLDALPCCCEVWARAVSVSSSEGGPSPTEFVAITRTAYSVSSARLVMV